MTWSPRYSVQKAAGVGGAPIPGDEPCLVIRAQDVLAGLMLEEYIVHYTTLRGHDPEVLLELRAHRFALINWQLEHPPKVADR
jgi:hypothetical protein